jgi:glucosylceramidase
MSRMRGPYPPVWIGGFCLIALLALTSSIAAAAPLSYSDVAVTQATAYVTAQPTGLRLQSTGALTFQALQQPEEHSPVIILDTTRRFQTIVGFGGAFTDAAAETFAELPTSAQDELLTAYFSPDPTRGNGYTMGRVNINSCDFSTETYSYDDVAGDLSLSHFSIAHDQTYKMPFIKAAMATTGHHLSLFATPWSPPAWMKTNDDMLHGGRLRPECRQAWANYYVRFVQAYEQAGIPMWGLSVQNEPMADQTFESCLWTGPEERDFVRDYLGPTLHNAGLGRLHLMIWDHNRGLMYQRAQAVYEDPAAARYVWGTAFHWYTGDHFDNTEMVHEAFPDKNLLYTEGASGLLDLTKPDVDWANGEKIGKNIMMDLNHWTNGWTEWNLILKADGTPNHDGGAGTASIAVVGDTKDGKLFYTSAYYYIGQFSRFIRPGAQRIACTSDDDDLLATSFVNKDNSIATVVLSVSDNAKDFSVWDDGRQVTTNSPAHSIVTVVMSP